MVRFFNTVGPRQTGRYGMVVPSFVKPALAEKTLTVHGDGEGFEDMRRRTPDIGKPNWAIGFEPQYDIDDILRDVVDYYRSGEEAPEAARPEAKKAAVG